VVVDGGVRHGRSGPLLSHGRYEFFLPVRNQ
jgi:hypothetical protein